MLVANGDNDAMLPTKNNSLLAKRLPNARLSIYPDAGHGFLFQYPAQALVVRDGQLYEGWRVSGDDRIEVKAEVQDHAYLVTCR